MKRVGDWRPVGKGNGLDGRSVPQSENQALQAHGKGKRTLGGGYRGGFLSWRVAAEAGIKASATFKARGCTFRGWRELPSIGDGGWHQKTGPAQPPEKRKR